MNRFFFESELVFLQRKTRLNNKNKKTSLKMNLKRSYNLINLFLAMTLVTSCNNEYDDNSANKTVQTLVIDGSCDYLSLKNIEKAGWKIIQCPEWITPVNYSGDADEEIKIYVESYAGEGTRTGKIEVVYDNGVTRSSDVEQSQQPETYLQRSRAVGWSYDVRTYSDSRGLRNQIFNTQKLLNFDPDAYEYVRETSTDLQYRYGESVSELSKDMSANLNLGGKFGTFSLELQGAFGSSAANNSKRIFAKIRGLYYYRTVYINVDEYDAMENDLFTLDFKNTRKNIMEAIDRGNQDEIEKVLSRFVDQYGTHYITNAYLGGYTDYYYSSVLTDNSKNLNIEGAIKFGYSSKFSLQGDVKYEDDFKNLNNETIETFVVKGGNSVELANKVVSGTVNQEEIDKWRNDMANNEQFELLSFNVRPIYNLFPAGYDERIKEYFDKIYYNEIPVTRVQNDF